MKNFFTLLAIALTLCLTSCSADDPQTTTSVSQPENKVAVLLSNGTGQPPHGQTFWSDNSTPTTMEFSGHEWGFFKNEQVYIQKITFKTLDIPDIQKITVRLNKKNIANKVLERNKYYEITFKQVDGIWQPDDVRLSI